MKQMRKELFGIRVAAIIEILVMLGFVLLVDAIFGNRERLRDLLLHPFWIPIVLVSVQYGSKEGLFAVALSTAALYLGNVPPQPLELDRYLYLYSILKLPLFWLVTAVILGEIRMKHRGVEEELRFNLLEAEQREQTLAQACDSLIKQRDSLHKRLAGNMRSALVAIEAFKNLDRLDEDQIHSLLEGIVGSILGPKKFSVFKLEEKKLLLIQQGGWEASDSYKTEITAEHPIFQSVVNKRKPLCAVNPEDENLLDGEGVAVAPILFPDSGTFYGMIKIEELSFAELNSAMLYTLEAICQWAGRALDTNKQIQEIQTHRQASKDYVPQTLGSHTKQIGLLTALAEKLRFDITQLQIDLKEKKDKIEQKRLSDKLHEVVGNTLASTDRPFDCFTNGSRYLVVLPATSIKSAEVLMKHICKQLGKDAAHFFINKEALVAQDKNIAKRVVKG